MQATNPFAQMPTTPEPIIAQVRRQFADDDRVGAQVPTGVLDRVADQAVRELWGSPVWRRMELRNGHLAGEVR